MALLERTSRQEILTTYQFSRVADATPVERFRTLFYLLIGHGRRHGWRWSPTQANHKRLLDTEARQPAKQGNSKAFCKCMLSLVESLSAEFDLGQASSPQDTKNAVLTVEYGDRQGAWMAKPSTCGIDAAYRGNMVSEKGELTGFAVLPPHTVLLAFGRIFDVCLVRVLERTTWGRWLCLMRCCISGMGACISRQDVV